MYIIFKIFKKKKKQKNYKKKSKNYKYTCVEERCGT